MKAEERHRLETNALATRVSAVIDRLGTHTSTVAAVVIGVAVILLVWPYLAGTWSSNQSDAWNSYNEAIEAPMPNLVVLKQAAEEYPGTPMQELADATWADGQIWMATREYISQRAAATEAAGRAMSVYQSLIQSSDDARLKNRARYGLARAYEIQDQIDKARETYLSVEGAFERLAKLRAENLDRTRTKDALEWLSKAEAPRRSMPTGPGTPGKNPAFNADELTMPGADQGPANPNAKDLPIQLQKMLQGFDLNDKSGTSPDRYGTGEAPPAGEAPPTDAPPTDTPPSDAPTNEKPSE